MPTIEAHLDAMKKEFLRITKASRCEAKVVDYDRVLFQVPLDELEKANSRWLDKDQAFREKFPLEKATTADEDCFLHVQVQAIVPDLVPANLGDFVVIFDTWSLNPKEFDVGFVTSVRKIKGERCYGVRHIIPQDGLNRQSALGESVLEVTSDDYGGFPVGFYKVVDQKTAVRLVAEKVRAKVKERIREMTESADSVEETLSAILEGFKHRSSAEFLSNDERQPKSYGD